MNQREYVSGWKIVLLGAVTIVLVIAIFMGILMVSKVYGRAQKRADAENQVKVTHILIAKAEQQAEINRAQIAATKAEATKRFEEAKGIRAAQDEIQATLTERYIQHEAIQAQKAIATSGRNNSIIYVPSGPNGVPLMRDTSAGTKTGDQQTAP